MWWLIPIAVVGVGKVIYDAIANGSDIEMSRKRSILESNLDRLGIELRSRNEKKVGILGQPGAGKSSLLKGMTGGAVRPLPVIGTQTDATNWSEDTNCPLLSFHQEYVFVDVPGYDTASHPTSVFILNFPWNQFDIFILVIGGKLHLADESIYMRIEQEGKKIYFARSFSESLDESDKVAALRDLRTRFSASKKKRVIFFSNRTGDGVADVYRSIKS